MQGWIVLVRRALASVVEVIRAKRSHSGGVQRCFVEVVSESAYNGRRRRLGDPRAIQRCSPR